MASVEKIQLYVSKNESLHKEGNGEQIITVQVNLVRTAIDNILAIKKDLSGSLQELENYLGDLSTFFREQKFATVVLPVLDQIAKEDKELWSVAKQGKTQIPLIPKSFENMTASSAEVRGKYGEIHCKLIRDRELALLSVYDITLETLGEIFRILSKNSA